MPVRFSDTVLSEIRSRISIVEEISVHVSLRKTGRNHVGLCPFHDEKTPSFSVNEEHAFFHCFGCGAGGDVFSFLRRIEGLDFPAVGWRPRPASACRRRPRTRGRASTRGCTS